MSLTPSPRPPERRTSAPILWDIVEEHFQEAAFLWRQRERALRAPDQSLADIAEGDEPRLVAHLEGLLLAGPRAAERLLGPALREGTPRRGGGGRALSAWPREDPGATDVVPL
ncbi:hypothetical protein ACLESO_49930, partial [Pyxidicoccus sp. 3LG]